MKAALEEAKKYLKDPNVTGVFTACRHKDGVWTEGEDLIIQFHVRAKKPVAQLKASEVLPKRIINTETDVVESNPIPVYRSHLNAVQPGVSIGMEEYTGAGSLGIIVKDGTGQLYGITNAHCILVPGAATPTMSSAILHPAREDTGRIGKNRIGAPDRYVLANNVDAAAIKLIYPAGLSVFGTTIIPSSVVPSPIVEDILAKHGRTTGAQLGRVTGYGVTTPDYLLWNIAGINHSVFITVQGDPESSDPIAVGGDSGSTWYYQDTGEAVGICTAANEEGSICYSCYLDLCLAALNFDPVTQLAWNDYIGETTGSFNICLPISKDWKGALEMAKAGPMFVERLTAVYQDPTEGYDPIDQILADCGITFIEDV